MTHLKFKVTQTRTVYIYAEDMGDAADAARYYFRGEPKPDEIPAVKSGMVRITKLEVDEA